METNNSAVSSSSATVNQNDADIISDVPIVLHTETERGSLVTSATGAVEDASQVTANHPMAKKHSQSDSPSTSDPHPIHNMLPVTILSVHTNTTEGESQSGNVPRPHGNHSTLARPLLESSSDPSSSNIVFVDSSDPEQNRRLRTHRDVTRKLLDNFSREELERLIGVFIHNGVRRMDGNIQNFAFLFFFQKFIFHLWREDLFCLKFQLKC